MSQYHLMEKRANIIDYESCNKSFIENDWAPNTEIPLPEAALCFADREPGSTSCHGDSGGPAVCKTKDGRWELVGVTSWGTGLCSTDSPIVYQSVGYYRKWIDSIMNGEDPLCNDAD
ncbi:hypothetical protein ScPMuIL_008996 [Solemya velum]